jgi:hypothetical protein
MDELTIGDKVYISTKRAADITGYAKDYVGQLCREGRVEATLVGRSWYVLESSIREHRFGEETKKTSSFDEKEPILNTWSVPVYKPEPVVEVPKLNTRESTPPSSDETIEDMQAAWKEWFVSREEKSVAPVVANRIEPEVIQESEDEVLSSEETEQELEYTDPVPFTPEIEVPVQVTRDYNHEEPISIEHVERAVRQREEYEPQVEPRVSRARRGRRKGSASLLVVRALLVGVMLVTVAVTLIGLGFADQYAFKQDARYEAVRFFSGVESVEK